MCWRVDAMAVKDGECVKELPDSQSIDVTAAPSAVDMEDSWLVEEVGVENSTSRRGSSESMASTMEK